MKNSSKKITTGLTLVLGGSGKTGRRVATRLRSLNTPMRIGSRAGAPAFDWNRESSWDACLEGVENVYLNYAPDLAIPGARDTIHAFVDRTKKKGAQRIVLLSGRGEDEAQACERIVQDSGLEWTIVRASWFNQNFSEGAFVHMVQSGAITLPGAGVLEPWIDVDDIADVVTAALTDPRHVGQLYEVTGPRLLTLSDIAGELSKATGSRIQYFESPHEDFLEGMKAMETPKDVIWLLDYLFATVLDGRNAYLADGIQRALGRPPKDFSQFAQETGNSNVWHTVAS